MHPTRLPIQDYDTLSVEVVDLESTDLEQVTTEPPMEVERPAQEERDSTGGSGTGDYRVILYNDEWHGQDEVILQLQKATGCDLHTAISIMLEAHTRGRARCYHGSRAECHRVARVLREIHLQCEVDCD